MGISLKEQFYVRLKKADELGQVQSLRAALDVFLGEYEKVLVRSKITEMSKYKKTVQSDIKGLCTALIEVIEKS